MKAGIGCNPTMNKDTAKISNLFLQELRQEPLQVEFRFDSAATTILPISNPDGNSHSDSSFAKVLR